MSAPLSENSGSRTIRTHCRCCSAVCGILVAAEGETVLRVRGDPQDSRSHGYICPKGALLPAFHTDPARLLAPRLHGAAASWDAVLDDAAALMRRAIDESGPGSVAFYQGTGNTLDSLGMNARARLLAGLPGAQFYSAATVDVAPALIAAEMATGWPDVLPVWTPEDEACRLALFIGFNPLVSHGYVTILPDPLNRIRKFRERGGLLYVIDPRQTRTAGEADQHFVIRPGSDAWLLSWLLQQLLSSDLPLPDDVDPTEIETLRGVIQGVSLERTIAETGIAAGALHTLLDAIRSAGQLTIVAGTGITLGADALLVEWLRWAILAVTGSLDRPGGMMFDPGLLHPMDSRPPAPFPAAPPSPGPASRPELRRVFGELPSIAIPDEIEAGNIRCLVVIGGSPLTALPDPARTARIFEKLDALIVLDILETPLTMMASHVLSVTGQLERDDLVVESRTMLAPAIVSPVGERRATWRVLAGLGERLGIDILFGRDANRLSDSDMIRAMITAGGVDAEALLAAGPDGLAHARRGGWVREKLLTGGRWRLVSPDFVERLAALISRPSDPGGLRIVSGRQVGRVNATTYVPPGKSRDRPAIHLNPADAARAGVGDGEQVQVVSAEGRLSGLVLCDSAIPPGTIGLHHGWAQSNAAALTSHVRVDLLTGQPAMTAISVQIMKDAPAG